MGTDETRRYYITGEMKPVGILPMKVLCEPGQMKPVGIMLPGQMNRYYLTGTDEARRYTGTDECYRDR